MKNYKTGLSIIILMCLILTGCNCNFNTDNSCADGSGNIQNEGLAAGNNDNIYYIVNSKLKKTDLNGKELLSSENFNGFKLQYMNHYIYYIDAQDCLYRIDTQNDEKSKIKDNKKFYNYVVYNGSIYYTDKAVGSIYKAEDDGTGDTLVYKGKCKNIIIDNDYIYYEDLSEMNKEKNMGDIKKHIDRVSIDGKNNKVICEDDWLVTNNTFYNVDHEWIYYVNADGYLCKVKTDGRNKKILTTDKCSNINVYNGNVYFINLSCENKLFKIKTDGSDEKKIVDSECMNINIIGKWIFYSDSNSLKEYKANLDGTGKVMLK